MNAYASKNVVPFSIMDKLEETICRVYKKRHHVFLEECAQRSLNELIGTACDILQQVHLVFRMIAWVENKTQFKRFLLKEISDSTHLIPIAIKNGDSEELQNYIAKYQCLLVAFKEEFNLFSEYLYDDPALLIEIQKIIEKEK